MISESINSSHKGSAPFLLQPAGKDYLWGGMRLKDDFAKDVDLDPLAETWECSTHPDGESTVATGPFAGQALSQVLKAHPEYLGSNPNTVGELPILIKLIDAQKDLSVQVHPDDVYAKTYESGQLGKTEMWYVLDASPDAQLVYGFSRTLTREMVRESIEAGTIEKYLQKVPIHRDDVFFIEAGTVHAIGAGALIAEIQESSNLTYRMYDYGRTDKQGNRRPVHIEKALDVMDLSACQAPRQPMRVLRYRRGYATEFLCRCPYFQVERMLLNTEICHEMAQIQTDCHSFQVLLCTEGCGVINGDDGLVLNFFRGDCLFIPANSMVLCLHGKAQFLKVRC